MLATPSLHARNLNAPLWRITLPLKPETSVFRKELAHRSSISYAVPSERIRDLIPVEFDLAETTILSIESFLDCGRISFEQTNYRFHVAQQGNACSWLLGASLGSLSGVTARHLYPLPWHLSAMELRVAFAAGSDKYSRYHLSSQSQWANTEWEISDTGEAVMAEKPGTITDYFVRRDGAIGNYQTIYQTAGSTRGKLQAGRCDLLGTLGILSSEEINHPFSVVLQRAVSCEIRPAAGLSKARMAA